MKQLLKWCGLGMVLLLVVQAGAQTLKEGDAPPPLKVAKWIKGNPVNEFRKDHVYVVEFWATWCGPCRRSIPHLTELAKKHQGKVTFIGVSIWERAPIETVEKFVSNMGDKMDYLVAADDSEGTMSKTWMQAAQQNGVPTAFVIKDGKIVWIGHPMELDDPLEQILKGTFNWQEAARQRQDAERQQNLLRELSRTLQPQIQQGQYDKALQTLDKFLEQNPDIRSELVFLRFNLLLRHDEAQAYTYARQLMENELKDSPDGLNSLAWAIVEDNPRLKLKQPDYDLAVQLAERAVQKSPEDPNILDTLAYAYFKKGEISKAIETQRKAVALAEKDPEFDKQALTEMRQRLERFEKASQQAK